MKPSSYILCFKSVQAEIKTHAVAPRMYTSIPALHKVVKGGEGWQSPAATVRHLCTTGRPKNYLHFCSTLYSYLSTHHNLMMVDSAKSLLKYCS
jgi:hypothetical protein